jgi:hypothetical protein
MAFKPVIALAEAFGHADEMPGLSNEHLAELVRDHYEHIQYLIVRHEIRTALKTYFILPDFTVYRHRKESENYLDTHESIAQMVEHYGVEHLRRSEVWYFCHRTHKTYIRLLLLKYGIKVNRWITTTRYDRNSSQRWTRNAILCNWCKIRRGLKYLFSGKLSSR